MKTVIIIPARYKSSRFPGKALIDILGQSLVQRVWNQCIKVIDSNQVYIATDDERIKNHCEEAGMQYIMTSENCLTGTDRVAEAQRKITEKYDVIINVQGDEPLVKPNDILKVIKTYQKFANIICCGTCKIKSEEEFRNPNIIKIVKNKDNDLLYASRAAIPTNKNLGFEKAYKQVCIYAFSPSILSVYTSVKKKSPLEEIEDIEFLRFLERGYNIKMVEVSNSSISVDIPEDIYKIKSALKEDL